MSSFSQKCFIALEEEIPDRRWLEFYQALKPDYHAWFFAQGDMLRPSLLECREALAKWLPKLLPTWEHLLHLSDASEWEARMLSMYCPAPYVSGCTQCVWTRYNPILVCNYDYQPDLCEGRLLKSRWHDTWVIAMTDSLWGALDGMNQHGLSASLAFGGQDIQGPGFGMPLVLRYVLEFCKNTEEALAVLTQVPVHMAYNVTVLDAQGRVATVEICPGMTPKVSNMPFAVNHQGDFNLNNYALFSRSLERRQALLDQLYDPHANIESFINAFQYAPLFTTDYQQGFGTLYTAVYNPVSRAMEYRWPYQQRMYQSFDNFQNREVWVTF